MYIRIDNKVRGILHISRAIGITLLVEYTLVLFNITAMNSPMTFPSPYEFYPCATQNKAGSEIQADCSKINQNFTMPLYKNTFMNDNLSMAMYLGIDLFAFQLNDIWFDFINLALISIYFFSFGNPILN